MVLTPSQTVNFKPRSVVGTTGAPLLLTAGSQYVQNILLEKGWNWISFNVYNNNFNDPSKLLGNYDWHDGDIVTDETNSRSLIYKNKKWIANGNSKSGQPLTVGNSYRIRVKNDVTMEISGDILKQQALRTITVKKGWNSIGYTPMQNLPIATALSDYLSQATDGDVVKSHDEFAMFVDDGKGSGEWQGNLRYMRPGEGYMIFRQGEGTVTFRYPFYEPGSVFFEGSSKAPARVAPKYSSTMSLTAVAAGIDVQPGDRLVAYADGEVRGEAILSPSHLLTSSPLFFMSISGDVATPLSFTIERDGELLGTTAQMLGFSPNAICGSASDATVISFVRSDQLPRDGWYTLQGIKLNGQPQQSGIYIHNGKKVKM